MTRRALAFHLPPLFCLLAVLLLLFWPLSLTHAVIGHPLSDMSDHLWGAWWWGGELLRGRLPLETHISHLPDGSPLWFVDPVGAALCLLLRPLGFPLAFNLTLLITVGAAGVAIYGLAWRTLARRGAACLAAVALMASPYLLGLLHSGLTEYLGLLPPVLFVGLLWGALEGRSRPWWAGVALAACTLQSFYYGVFAVLLAACSLLGADWWRRLRVVAEVVVSGLLLSLPLLWAAGGTVFGAAGAVGQGTAPGWDQAMLPATDISLFLRPGRHYFPDTPAMGNPGILHVHYLGWVLVLLAGWGYTHHPRLRSHRGSVLLYATATLGPALAWWGRPLLWGRQPLPLPLAVLYQLPPWNLVHHPYRLVSFLVILLALGAAGAVSLWGRWAWVGAAAALLVESLLFSPAVWPLVSTPWGVPSVYEALPEGGGVLDWPPDGTRWNRLYQLWQVEHGRPIPYGLNVFLTEPVLRDPLVARLLLELDNPMARARNRDVPRPLALTPPVVGESSRLADMGLRYLVLHRQALAAGEWEGSVRCLDDGLGAPLLTMGDERVWTLR